MEEIWDNRYKYGVDAAKFWEYIQQNEGMRIS